MSKKQVMTVTESVYKLTQRFSELRVKLEEKDDPKLKDEMDLVALAIANHLLLNELRVLSDKE